MSAPREWMFCTLHGTRDLDVGFCRVCGGDRNLIQVIPKHTEWAEWETQAEDRGYERGVQDSITKASQDLSYYEKDRVDDRHEMALGALEDALDYIRSLLPAKGPGER